MANDRLKSFGFPRWGEYGQDREAEAVRMCDYTGCNERGDHPAPKSPGGKERWYFCRPHAAEYNRNWDYFSGMSDEEARRAMENENKGADAFASANPFEWGGAEDGDGHTSTDHSAYDALELDPGAGMDAIKRQYRKLAKKYHPDANIGDPQATERFHEIQAAYDHLSQKFTDA